MKRSVKLIEKLLQLTKDQYKFQLKYPRDCVALSNAIFAKTNTKLSESTLKRIYGLVKTKDHPSKFTLNTLSIYCGFNDFQDFGDSFNQNNISNIKWDQLKDNSRIVSGYTLESIKQNSGIGFQNTLKRKSVFNQVSELYHSNNIATAVIAEGGTGKSISLAQVADEFWLGENPKYSNDIVWFISGSNLRGMFSKQFELETWFLEMFGLVKNSDIRKYLDQNPQERKGKLILILDAVDEIVIKTDELDEIFRKLIEFISSSATNNWIKVILSTRSHTWERFIEISKDYNGIAKLFYGVNFNNLTDDVSNLPVLEVSEVKTIIKNYQRESKDLKIELNNITPNLWRILSHPYYLQLYLQGYFEEKNEINNSYDLLSSFLKYRVYKGRYGFEKNEIFQAIIQNTSIGSKSVSVKRKEIESILNRYHRAYKELLSFGILKEQSVLNKFKVYVNYISFGHDHLFEFLIAKYWLEQNNGFNFTVLLKVTKFYDGNEKRLDILKQIISYGLETGEYKELVRIFDLKLEEYELNALSHLMGMHIRTSTEAQNLLLKDWAVNKNAQIYFYERFVDLDNMNGYFGEMLPYYIKAKQSHEAKIFGTSLLYLNKYLNSDFKNPFQNFDITSKSNLKYNIHPLPFGRQLAVHILMEKVVNHKMILEYIVKSSKTKDRITGFPAGCHFHVMEAYFLKGLYLNISSIYAHAVSEIKNLSDFSNTWFFQMIKVYHCVALHSEKKNKKAQILFREIEFDTMFVNAPWYKNYFRVQYLLAEWIIFCQRKSEKRGKLVKSEILSLSEKLGFDFYPKMLN